MYTTPSNRVSPVRSRRPTGGGHRQLASMLLLALACSHAAQAFAIRLPTGTHANRVIDYYYSDASRPVLMEFGLCRGIHRQGEHRYDCRGPLTESEIERGMTVFAWMKFLVPQRASPRIRLRVDHDGVEHHTWSRTLEPAIRYRTWHEVELGEHGHWRFEVFDEGSDPPKRLYSRSVTLR